MSQLSEQVDFSKIQPRLSAPLARLRKQWLSAVKDLAPQSALAVLRERFAQETDGAMRLGNIAAQSWIIRQRLISLQTSIHGHQAQPPHADVADEAPAVATANTATSAPEALAERVEAPPAAAPEWIKLRILRETEVNGMRFFEGSTIEVRSDDARKLIAAKSAEGVEVDNTEHPARAPETKSKSAKKK
jgi:hypothetical protein